MADTTSIASRMEKLAKLKRMKQGLAAGSAPASDAVQTPDIAAPETTVSATAHDHATAPNSQQVPDSHALKSPAEDHTDYESHFSFSANDDEPEAHGIEPTLDTDPGFDDEPTLDAEPFFEDEPTLADEPDSAETIAADETRLDIENSVESTNAEADEPDGSDFEIPAELMDDTDEGGETMSANDLGIDDEAMDALDDIVAIAGVSEARQEDARPDFTTKEIDPELLEREFSDESPVKYKSKETETEAESEPDDVPVATEDEAGRVTISFDDSRSTLLKHVSRQMGCSAEDVVVTALDWYLDALFGEEGEEEAKAG